MRFLVALVAIAGMSICLTAAEAGPAAQDDVLQRFVLDLAPTGQTAADPTQAVLKRMPGLKGLATKMIYGPSTAELVTISTPENAPKIADIVKTYMDRPQLAYSYAFELPGQMNQGAILAFEQSDLFAGKARLDRIGDHVISGWELQVRGRATGDKVVTEVKAAGYIDGRKNAYDGAIQLTPDQPSTIEFGGPDHLKLTLRLHLYRP